MAPQPSRVRKDHPKLPGGLTVRAKAIALVGITASIGVSAVLLTSDTTLRVILVAVAAVAWLYVLSRPTKPLSATV